MQKMEEKKSHSKIAPESESYEAQSWDGANLIIRRLGIKLFRSLATFEGNANAYEFWTRLSKHCGMRLYADCDPHHEIMVNPTNQRPNHIRDIVPSLVPT